MKLTKVQVHQNNREVIDFLKKKRKEKATSFSFLFLQLKAIISFYQHRGESTKEGKCTVDCRVMSTLYKNSVKEKQKPNNKNDRKTNFHMSFSLSNYLLCNCVFSFIIYFHFTGRLSYSAGSPTPGCCGALQDIYVGL